MNRLLEAQPLLSVRLSLLKQPWSLAQRLLSRQSLLVIQLSLLLGPRWLLLVQPLWSLWGLLSTAHKA